MRTYTTQMDAARQGIISPEMKEVAKQEYRTEEEMREFDGDIEEPQDIDDKPEDLFDATAFDKTALCKLDAIFGDKLTLR